jgi:hypothetical protein
MTLCTLVHILICVTCVDLGVFMLSIIQNMDVCVHRSAINCPHCRFVLRDVGIPNMLHSARCSWRLIYHILARSWHITTRPVLCVYMQGNLWSETLRTKEDAHYLLFPRLLALQGRDVF